jgi:hypothetical protein
MNTPAPTSTPRPSPIIYRTPSAGILLSSLNPPPATICSVGVWVYSVKFRAGDAEVKFMLSSESRLTMTRFSDLIRTEFPESVITGITFAAKSQYYRDLPLPLKGWEHEFPELRKLLTPTSNLCQEVVEPTPTPTAALSPPFHNNADGSPTGGTFSGMYLCTDTCTVDVLEVEFTTIPSQKGTVPRILRRAIPLHVYGGNPSAALDDLQKKYPKCYVGPRAVIKAGTTHFDHIFSPISDWAPLFGQKYAVHNAPLVNNSLIWENKVVTFVPAVSASTVKEALTAMFYAAFVDGHPWFDAPPVHLYPETGMEFSSQDYLAEKHGDGLKILPWIQIQMALDKAIPACVTWTQTNLPGKVLREGVKALVYEANKKSVFPPLVGISKIARL